MSEPDQNTESALPSSLRSAIGALKGRAPANDRPAEQGQAASPARELSVVSSKPISEEELFPVSADLPEGKIRKQLSDLQEEKQSLMQALESTQGVVQDLVSQLAEANARIATLQLERNQGIEGIIENLRQFQTDAARSGPVIASGTTLSDIFSTNSQLAARAANANFHVRWEKDLCLALDVIKTASGNAFSFDVETAERGDFFKINVSAADSNLPAKMMIINLKKSTSNTGATNLKEKIVIISVDNKIFYLKDQDFKARFDRKTAFLQTNNGNWSGVFKLNGSKLIYSHQDISSSYEMKGPFDTVSKFVDEFLGHCLPRVLESTEFDQAARSLKAMGLVP